jgi:hypothetical protein
MSFALDQVNQFVEADEVRNRARELLPDEIRLSELGVRGTLERIRYPSLGRKHIERLRREVPPEAQQLVGGGGLRQPIVTWIANPVTGVFFMATIVGWIGVALRTKFMWTAQACTKCGKVFCPRCKSATESASYCSQCISVFLKRDVVAMEQQQAKMARIERWDKLVWLGRRIAAVLSPGGGLVFDGKLLRGFALGLAGWLCLFGLLIWSPLFVRSVEPYATTVPLQVLFGLFAAGIWFLSVMLAWSRR